MPPVTRAVINLAPPHKFKGLSKWPEAQLLMLVPRVLWNRTRIYVPHFEAVHLAGRFGADPGDYEWEVLSEPQGFKWWRRTVGGDAAYCAFVVAPDVGLDPIEVFGMVDIASDTPWWFDACRDSVLVETRGDIYARQNRLSEHEGKVFISIRDEYGPQKIVTTVKDENGVAWRVGVLEEVERLRDAFVALINRARTAALPDEARTGKTGELRPPATPFKPGGTGSLSPERPSTGSLKDALGNLLKPKTGPIKK
jgi:hypothetical protein